MAVGSVMPAVMAARGFAPAVLLVFCLIVFLPGFFSIPPVDRDAPRFAQAAKQMLESGDFGDSRLQDEPRHAKPVAICWLQAASAALAVALIDWIGSGLFDRRIGYLAAIILAGCILLGVEARLARTDAALLATVVAMQAMLARIYLPVSGKPVSRKMPLVFWASLGLGAS